jgi:hypothetical protein
MNQILFKRGLAALGIALCLTLTACGGGDDGDLTPPPANGQPDQPPPANGSTPSPLHCAP